MKRGVFVKMLRKHSFGSWGVEPESQNEKKPQGRIPAKPGKKSGIYPIFRGSSEWGKRELEAGVGSPGDCLEAKEKFRKVCGIRYY